MEMEGERHGRLNTLVTAKVSTSSRHPESS
jgi:hypothetical protein